MTSNCEPQCKKFFVGDFFVSRIHCTKIVLIFITTLLFDLIAIFVHYPSMVRTPSLRAENWH